MAENMRLNKVGARTHPCFTPLETWNGSEFSPLSWTLASMPHDAYKLTGATILCHNSPEAISTDGVKRFRQIDKGGVEVNILFLALLLELSDSKHYVGSSTAFPKATLTLWQ